MAAESFEERMARFDAYDAKVAAALEALTEVLLDPVPSAFQPRRNALLEALRWLEVDATCGDCVTGRCHWGGEKSRASIAAATAGGEYTDPDFGPCGCARHEASARARERDARLRAAGILPDPAPQPATTAAPAADTTPGDERA